LCLTWISRIRRRRCEVRFIFFSNFIVSSYFASTFKFQCYFLMFLLFVVNAWWIIYGTRVPNLQNIIIQVLIQTCSSSRCKQNKSVFEKIHTNKCNWLKKFKLSFEFVKIVNYNLLFYATPLSNYNMYYNY